MKKVRLINNDNSTIIEILEDEITSILYSINTEIYIYYRNNYIILENNNGFLLSFKYEDVEDKLFTNNIEDYIKKLSEDGYFRGTKNNIKSDLTFEPENSNSILNIIYLSEENYNNGIKNNNTLYIII